MFTLSDWGTDVPPVCLLWPFAFRFLWVNREMPHRKLLVSYRVTRDNTTTSRMDQPGSKIFILLTAKTFLSITCRDCGSVCDQQELPYRSPVFLCSCHLKLRLGNFCKRSSAAKSNPAWNWGLTAEFCLIFAFSSATANTNHLVSPSFQRSAYHKAHRGHLWQWERAKHPLCMMNFYSSYWQQFHTL